MLNRIRSLSRLPTFAIASLVVAGLSQANIFRVALESKEAIMGLQMAKSWAGYQAVLEAWTPADFEAYWAHFTPDLFHPFFYGIAGALMMAWALRSSGASARWNVLMLLTPLAGALDLVENTCHGIAVSSYPAVPYWTFLVGNPAAHFKWLLVVGTVVGIVVGFVRGRLRR